MTKAALLFSDQEIETAILRLEISRAKAHLAQLEEMADTAKCEHSWVDVNVHDNHYTDWRECEKCGLEAGRG